MAAYAVANEAWPTLIILLLIVGFLSIGIYRVFVSPLSEFPGPVWAALSGFYELYHHVIKRDWLENLERLHQKHGPIVRIGPNELHIIDHQWCLNIHRRTDASKSPSYYGLLGKLLGGLESSKEHTVRKSILHPLFKGPQLSNFVETMGGHIGILCTKLGEATGQGGEVNATYYLWAFTNDIMMSFLTACDHGYMHLDDLASFHDSTRAFGAIDLATTMRAMPILSILVNRFSFLRAASPLAWIDKVMSGKMSCTPSDPKRSILSIMRAALDDDNLTIQEASQAIFIGNESLLSNITFALHHLLQHPLWIVCLRKELDNLAASQGGILRWDDDNILKLPILDAIVNESTRLSAPGWHRQPRHMAYDLLFGNKVIPAGTSISFTVKMSERDPTIYPRSREFLPDRWLDVSKQGHNARKYSVAFGTGSRTCLGQHIARNVLRKTVAALFFNFDISLVHEGQAQEDGFQYLNTYPVKGREGYMRLRLAPRSSPDVN